jgi:co-chaperonin GroES (HSP10)
MSTKIKPQVGVVYECYKGFTDSHGDRCRVGQKYIFKGGEAYENDDYYYMDKASRRGAQIEIAKDKFASHFCPANFEQAKQESDIEFKVGDKVMIDESSGFYNLDYGGDDNPKDTIGVISDILGDTKHGLNIRVDWSNGTNNYYNKSDLKLAKQESDIEFKVGDEVMIKESSEYYDGGRNNPKDTIGVISDIIDTDFPDELGIIVDWPTGQENSYNKSDLKLAKQKSYIDSDKNKPLKQQVMINAIAITDPEQIKALAIAIPSIKPQLQAQFPDLFITHKAGNRYENVDSGEEYILAHESNAVALVNLSTGTITSNTIHVDDIDNITADEFARMVNNPSDYELI